MADCLYCHKEMTAARTCDFPLIEVNGKVFERNTKYYDVNERCHDCGIENKRGNIHHFGCDIERCPLCGGQLISCPCNKTRLFKGVAII